MKVDIGSKEDALLLLEKQGVGYYAEASVGISKIYRLSGDGECCVTQVTLSREQTKMVIDALNEAFALGLQFGQNPQGENNVLTPGQELEKLSRQQRVISDRMRELSNEL